VQLSQKKKEYTMSPSKQEYIMSFSQIYIMCSCCVQMLE